MFNRSIPLIWCLLHEIRISAPIFECQWLPLVFHPRWFFLRSAELGPPVSLSKTVLPKCGLDLFWIGLFRTDSLFRMHIMSLTVFLFFLIGRMLFGWAAGVDADIKDAADVDIDFDPFKWRPFDSASIMFGIGFIGGGIPIGGGGGGTVNPPKPRGIKSSLSSSECRSVKSKSHSVNGRTIFFTNSSQCNSFSDFFGSGFLISWSLLGDLCVWKNKQRIHLAPNGGGMVSTVLTAICLLCFYFSLDLLWLSRSNRTCRSYRQCDFGFSLLAHLLVDCLVFVWDPLRCDHVWFAIAIVFHHFHSNLYGKKDMINTEVNVRFQFVFNNKTRRLIQNCTLSSKKHNTSIAFMQNNERRKAVKRPALTLVAIGSGHFFNARCAVG